MLLHSGIRPLMQFLRREVFFVGRDRPHMAKGVFDRPGPITVELILHGRSTFAPAATARSKHESTSLT